MKSTQVAQLIQLGRYEQARDMARELLASTPGDPELLNLLAQAMMNTKQAKEALKRIEQAISLDPTTAHHVALRAQLLRMLHRDGKALKAAKRAVALGPDEYFPHAVQADLALPEIGVRIIGGFSVQQAAQESCDALLRLFPSTAYTHVLAARRHFAERDYDAAITSAEDALRLDPNEAQAHQLRGLAQKALGDVHSAADSLVAAGKLEPTEAMANNLKYVLATKLPVAIIALAVVVFLGAMMFEEKNDQEPVLGDPGIIFVMTGERPLPEPTEIDGVTTIYVDKLTVAGDPVRGSDLVIPGTALLLVLILPILKHREVRKVDELSPQARSVFESVNKNL